MQYTHEHEEIQRTLKRFIDEEINPHVDEWEAAEAFPAHQVFKRLGELGLLGLTKPEKYGGMSLDYSYSVAMAETLGHVACGGVPMAIGVQTDMCTPALARFGSEALCREFLVPAITGDAVGCIGVSEPGAGSDVASIKTTARPGCFFRMRSLAQIIPAVAPAFSARNPAGCSTTDRASGLASRPMPCEIALVVE